MGLTNLGTPQVGNRAIIPLAIEAGIADLVESLVRFGMDKRTLLERLAAELEQSMLAIQGAPDLEVHPALNPAVIVEVLGLMSPGDIWGAINTEVLDALLAYLDADPASQVANVRSLPQTVPAAGPDAVGAERDLGTDPTSVIVTFDESPDGWTQYEIYVDFRLAKRGNNAAVGGQIEDVITVPYDGRPRSVRVLFVNLDANQMGRFGPPAQLA